MKGYDMAVLGGGPAGFTAALYGARAGLHVVVLEQLSAGGQMALTERLENYPGFPDGVDGFSLGEQMQRGAERFGAQTILAEVRGVELAGESKHLFTSAGEIQAKTVVLATGARPRKLGCQGEERLTGRGVHYCAACDGMRYSGKVVAVVGGGNAAVEDALALSRIAKKVYLIHRRDRLRAEQAAAQRLAASGNVEYHWNSTVESLLYGARFEGLLLRNIQDGASLSLPCDAVFVSIGREPETALFKGQVELDDAGYVRADETTQTSLPGVFAAGDLRTKPLRQVVTATADGAVAAHYAAQYLAGL